MTTNDRQEPCIEVIEWGGNRNLLSVREYEATLERAQRLGSPAARDREGVDWASHAPRVEELSLDQQQPAFISPKFRICDWPIYDAQMRELLGLN